MLCIAQAQIISRKERLTLSPTMVRLGRDRALSLSLDHFFEFVHPSDAPDRWAVRTSGYRYTVSDRDGHELVSYQWHPQARSPVTSPHLHLGSRLVRADSPLTPIHWPTGHVTFAEIVRALLRDQAVEPLRPDWDPVLRQSEDVQLAVSVQ
jgi:hypothetical protein